MDTIKLLRMVMVLMIRIMVMIRRMVRLMMKLPTFIYPSSMMKRSAPGGGR